MLVEEMDISRLITYIEQIEEEKMRKKAKSLRRYGLRMGLLLILLLGLSFIRRGYLAVSIKVRLLAVNLLLHAKSMEGTI